MTADAIVSLLLEVSWRTLVVAALVGVALVIWRVRGGAARHAAWTAVMVAMFLMPALMAIAPEWRLPVSLPTWSTGPDMVSDTRVLVAQPPSTAEVPAAGSGRIAAERTPAPVASLADVAQRVAEQPQAAGNRWLEAVVLAWVVGIVAHLVVMVMGWRLTRRLVATATTSEVDPRVYETTAVSTPCAVGVWRARILVPRVWRTWSRTGRDAVLTHELAHVRRRDLLVSCIARVNRAVFWFHPLSWWLERRIAAAAEQACDEVVLRAGQDPQRYAALLVELATVTRANGHRVAWQSLGMADGSGLEVRVERVMSGDVPRLSQWRAVGLALVVAAAVAVAAACQQAPPPLTEDQDVTADMAAYQIREAKWKAAQAMSLEEANALAAKVAAGDVADITEPGSALLTFYMSRGQALMGWNEMVAARRPVLLALIERHPESGLTRWPLTPRLDRDGWSQARTLWLTHVAKAGASAAVLGNAAGFFARTEPELSEELFRKAMALDPDGPRPRLKAGLYFQSWHNRLAELYAEVLIGATDENVFRPLSVFSAELTRRPMAQRIRRDLETTSDGRMLAEVGQHLVSWFQRRNPSPESEIGFDPVALGVAYLRRGLTLNADQPAAQVVLARYERHTAELRTSAKADALLGQTYFTASPEAVFALPADMQLALLPDLAARAAVRRDPALARRYSEAALALAGSGPEHEGVRFAVDLTLAYLAVTEGDRRTAVRHLRDATKIAETAAQPLSLETSSPLSLVTVPHKLLEAGERDSVADFYEAVAANLPDPGDTYQAAAAAVRAGRMPATYQRARR